MSEDFISSNSLLTAVAIDRNGYRHDWAERCVTENTGCERYYRADEVDKELERLRAAPETRAFQPGLADQIERAKQQIEAWPTDVRMAMGLALNGEDRT